MILQRRNISTAVLSALVVTAFIVLYFSAPSSPSDSSRSQSSKPGSRQFTVPMLKNPSNIKSNCSAHTELNRVDFLHDDLRPRLCNGTPAFTLVNGRFPPCKLPWDLPLTHLISPVDVKLPKLFSDSSHLTIYAHKGEWLTEMLVKGDWENIKVKLMILLIKEIGIDRTTFLDIGCNIGVYALNARSYGIKTVCIDANIRNMLRVLMSAKNLNFNDDKKFRIFWTFFNSKVSIEHFRFVSSECHIGAGAPFLPKSVMFEDPVPVASSRGDDLIGMIPSDVLVIKIDIESYEPEFFDSARNFFDVYRVAVVQMEIYRNPAQKPLEISFLENFFFLRKFQLFTTTLETGNLRNWKGDGDALWVHQDFVPLLKNIPKM